MASTFLLEDVAIEVPANVVDLCSFRGWLNSDTFPETGRISYSAGGVFVDMSQEQLYSHNQVKQELNRVIGNLATLEDCGIWFPDGAYLSNSEADFSYQPDGIFVSNEAFDTDRVREVEGKATGYLELEGTPDMVLEVVSTSSVQMDTITKREHYHRARIREYWLIDAREEPLRFEILKFTVRGYVSVRVQDGWLKSSVFGRAFQLTQRTNARGKPICRLTTR